KVVHSAVASDAVRLVFEPGLARGAVRLHEKRYLVLSSGVCRRRYLGINRRTRSSQRRLGMAAPAGVEVEAGAKPFRHRIHLLELVAAGVEEFELPICQS